MASKASKKKDKDGGAPKAASPKLFVLIQNACVMVAAICALLLFVGSFNVGPAALADIVHSFSIIPASLFALCLVGSVVTNGAIRSAERASLTAMIAEIEQKVEARVMEASAKVDTHIGDDYQALRTQNQQLREELDKLHEAEQARMAAEVEQLRSVNNELEEQIKRWAIGSVDQAIMDAEDEGIKVA